MAGPSKRPLRRIWSLAVLGLVLSVLTSLAACGSGPTPIVIVVTNTSMPEAAVIVVTATFTPAPESAPSETTPPPPASPPAPTDTPLAPTPTPVFSGPFRLVTPAEGMTAVDINDIWTDTGGRLWLASDQGLFRHADAGWSQLVAEPALRVQGEDAQGRVWVLLEGQASIGAYDTTGNWTVYGPEQGWVIPPDAEYLSAGYGDGLVTDTQGRLWLATGRDDLRSFDPGSGAWLVYTAADIGFDPPEEEGYQGHFVSDVALAPDGQLWVAHCMGMGESYLGQGIRSTDGVSWSAFPATAQQCVLDIEVDASGRVWAGGFDALQQYDPGTGAWSSVPLSEWDRRQLISDITLDAQGNPWVEIIRYGGASALGAVARYHLQGGSWVQDHDGWLGNLALSPDGSAWLCSEGRVYSLAGGSTEVASIGGLGCPIAADGQGRIWTASDTELWTYDPNQ